MGEPWGQMGRSHCGNGNNVNINGCGTLVVRLIPTTAGTPLRPRQPDP